MRSASASVSRGSARRNWRPDLWLVCAALLTLIPLQIMLRSGVPHTADGEVHLLRTLEVVRIWSEGVLYPRWAPDFYLGYGYPFFNFYVPGAHLLGALFASAGLGIVRGVLAVQILALLLYPTGAYLAARSVLPDERQFVAAGPAALLGAALYLYAPLRFRELFVQGNLSQWLALGLLPWCAWCLAKVARQRRFRQIAGAGVLLAALLYAHHPTAFLAWPSLAAYALAIALLAAAPVPVGRHKAIRQRMLALAGSFLLAIALGAPFWLPALGELRYVNINAIATGSFDVRLNLLPLSELLALPAIQDAAALNPPMPNSLGIVQSVLAALGLLAALLWCSRRASAETPADPTSESSGPWQGLRSLNPVIQRDDDWSYRQAGLVLVVVAGLLVVSLVLILPLAGPFWDVLPLGRWIAFPWRLLGPCLLWATLLGSAAIGLLPGRLRLAPSGCC